MFFPKCSSSGAVAVTAHFNERSRHIYLAFFFFFLPSVSGKCGKQAMPVWCFAIQKFTVALFHVRILEFKYTGM